MPIPPERITDHWTISRGVTYDRTWTWKDNGVAVNTTGGTCEAIFRATLNGSALLIANDGNGKVTVDNAGVFTWSLSPADILTLGDKGVMDLKFTESGGAVRSPYGGTYQVNDDN